MKSTEWHDHIGQARMDTVKAQTCNQLTKTILFNWGEGNDDDDDNLIGPDINLFIVFFVYAATSLLPFPSSRRIYICKSITYTDIYLVSRLRKQRGRRKKWKKERVGRMGWPPRDGNSRTNRVYITSNGRWQSSRVERALHFKFRSVHQFNRETEWERERERALIYTHNATQRSSGGQHP